MICCDGWCTPWSSKMFQDVRSTGCSWMQLDAFASFHSFPLRDYVTVATFAGRGTAERGRGPCQAGEGWGSHVVVLWTVSTVSPFVTKKLEIQVVAAVAAVGISSGRLLVAKEVASMRRCGEIAFSSGLGCFDAWDTRDACLRVDGIPFHRLDMSW